MKHKRIAALAIFSSALLLIIGTFSMIADDRSGTYVVFTIDTERDFPPILDSYQGIDDGVPILLDLFDRYDVTATFLVTGNVALMRPDVVEAISVTHEIGNHSMWHNEAIYNLSYQEKYERIVESTALLEGITGSKVISFRAPGHSCDTELLTVLEDLGYLVEASAYKGDSYPYNPSPYDWTESGDMDILRVPISNAPEYFYPFYYYGKSWVEAYEYLLNEQIDKDIKVIVIGLHPWELCDMELDDAYASTDRVCGTETYDKLVELLEYLKDKDVKYTTLSGIYDLFG